MYRHQRHARKPANSASPYTATILFLAYAILQCCRAVMGIYAACMATSHLKMAHSSLHEQNAVRLYCGILCTAQQQHVSNNEMKRVEFACLPFSWPSEAGSDLHCVQYTPEYGTKAPKQRQGKLPTS